MYLSKKKAHSCSNIKLRIKVLGFIHSQGRLGTSQLFMSNSTARLISIKERFGDNCEEHPRSDCCSLRFCSRELARIKFGYEN